jgi:predicted enzyme related to lactoylglutathione lyase
MSEREKYQPGVPCWVDTAQPDPEAATRFYGDLFDWEFIGPGPMPGVPPGRYFVARVRGRDVAGVSSQPQAGGSPVPAWNMYVSVKSVEKTAAKVIKAGGTVMVPPFDALPAGRMAVLRDPAGAVFCAWEARERQGAQLVNEPRAWAMNSLSTPDPDACTAFYGTVFGWKTDTFGGNGSAITLWRLPGYVGGEPRQPVPRDVVAVMSPARRDVPSHWGVDFWVDDADATATRAVKLGGKIVVPPHDVPAFRKAVLQDPQGAVFSVSRLTMGDRGQT